MGYTPSVQVGQKEKQDERNGNETQEERDPARNRASRARNLEEAAGNRRDDRKETPAGTVHGQSRRWAYILGPPDGRCAGVLCRDPRTPGELPAHGPGRNPGRTVEVVG